MQSGRLLLQEVDVRGASKVVLREPVLSRATFLPSLSADCILEGLTRRFPILVEDAAVVAAIADGFTSVVISFSHDRAAPNYVALRWFWDKLGGVPSPPNLYLHSMPCVLHGIQLARSRSLTCKQIIGASFSFTRLLRKWRSSSDLRAEMIRLVDARLQWDAAAAPTAATVSGEQRTALRILFGASIADVLDPNDDDGKPSFLADVRDILIVVVFGPGALTHRCRPIALASAEGAARTRPCCASREDAVEKATAKILNFSQCGNGPSAQRTAGPT